MKYFFVRLQQRLLQQKKRHEAARYLHLLEIERSEKESIQLRNEKLEQELAATAMQLMQKTELLAAVREEISRMKKSIRDEKTIADFRKIYQTLNAETRMDKEWEHFAIHFDKTHTDFLRVLKATYPRLSPTELKLCAYLRMNLSSKEIARLNNISVRGVELARYRLRRKLQLTTETTLYDFLLQFSAPKMEQ